MYQITVGIVGIAPLSFNRFSDQAMANLKSKKTGGKHSEEDRKKEVEERVYKNKDGLYIPAKWIKAAIMAGCTLSGEKEGKKGLYPYIQGTVFLDPPEIPLGKDTYDFVYERWGRIPPKTGAAAIIQTPAVREGWSSDFTLVVMDDRRNADQLKTVLETAGLLVGIGNNRPEFGRFMVSTWQVKKAGSS